MGSVIAQGAASGEFEVATSRSRRCAPAPAMIRFFHPQMIAQCANKPGPTIDEMIDFIIAGLSPRAKTGQALISVELRRVASRIHRPTIRSSIELLPRYARK